MAILDHRRSDERTVRKGTPRHGPSARAGPKPTSTARVARALGVCVLLIFVVGVAHAYFAGVAQHRARLTTGYWTSPGLVIGKSVEVAHSPALLGDPILYTIVVSNTGTADADEVLVRDLLPAGVEGTDLSWTGSINVGQHVSFTVEAMVSDHNSFLGETITNTAAFEHASGSGSASAAFTVIGPPVLTITKTVDTIHTPVHLGEAITYTIVLANSGPTAAAGVMVRDPLPRELSGEHLSWTGHLGAGEQVEFILPAVVDIDLDLAGETITNRAYYSYGADSGSDEASFTVRGLVRRYLPVIFGPP